MADVLHSIENMIEILNQAKRILEDNSLSAFLTYYEEGLYKVKSLAEVTNHVHQQVEMALNEILEQVSCSVKFGEQSDENEVITFTFESEMLGSIGEIEVPDPMLFIKGKSFGELLEEKDVDDLQKYTDLMVKLRNLLQKHKINVGFY